MYARLKSWYDKVRQLTRALGHNGSEFHYHADVAPSVSSLFAVVSAVSMPS